MTENIFRWDASDRFDYYDPENVAPTVAWLASDDAADVTGRVFIVGGGDVFLVQNFTADQPPRQRPALDRRRAHGQQGEALRGRDDGRARARHDARRLTDRLCVHGVARAARWWRCRTIRGTITHSVTMAASVTPTTP